MHYVPYPSAAHSLRAAHYLLRSHPCWHPDPASTANFNCKRIAALALETKRARESKWERFNINGGSRASHGDRPSPGSASPRW